MTFLKITSNPFEEGAKRWARVGERNLDPVVVGAAAAVAQSLVDEMYTRSLPIEEWDAFRDGLTVFTSPTDVWVGLDDEDASTVFGVEYGDLDVEDDRGISPVGEQPPRPVMQPAINATRDSNEEMFDAVLKVRMFR